MLHNLRLLSKFDFTRFEITYNLSSPMWHLSMLGNCDTCLISRIDPSRTHRWTAERNHARTRVKENFNVILCAHSFDGFTPTKRKSRVARERDYARQKPHSLFSTWRSLKLDKQEYVPPSVRCYSKPSTRSLANGKLNNNYTTIQFTVVSSLLHELPIFT